MLLLLSADIFHKNFFKNSFRNITRGSNSLGPDILSDLIWVATVCKDYQQMTRNATSKEELILSYKVKCALE